jgi:hypothetical protein
LICVFLMAKVVNHFFMYLLAICISSFENCLFIPFAQKEEWNYVIYRKMDITVDYHVMWDRSNSERQISGEECKMIDFKYPMFWLPGWEVT